VTVTHVTALRNTIADAVDNYLNTTGATDASADLQIQTAADAVLVEFTLQNPAFGAASSGSMSLAGTPLSATAGATGTAAKGRIRDRANADAVLFSVTLSGGGGDVIATNTSISSGQSCQITSLSYAAPA
jgi:hypothetical protein